MINKIEIYIKKTIIWWINLYFCDELIDPSRRTLLIRRYPRRERDLNGRFITII